ncbi:MAG TPA: ABC transporter permease [Microbacteriaceae bacterium]|nr:ABC transporter permease [Microbacteriaceae bacterium]
MAERNIGTVIRFEVVRTLSKRRFWVATLFVPVVLAIVFGLVAASNSSTSNAADAQKNAHFSFEYSDASGLIAPAIARAAGGTLQANAAEGVADVKSGKTDAFFRYPADPQRQTIRIAAQDVGVFANGKYDAVAQAVLKQSVEQKIGNPTLSALAATTIRTDTVTYTSGARAGGIASIIPPMLFLVLFYLVILLLGNQMLSATLEEKENRVTEMILTTIEARSLILGKVVSLFAVGLVQMLVFAIPVVIGYVFLRDRLNFPSLNLADLIFDPARMITGALILIGGFALFTGALVALGAVMPTARDAGPIYGALMILIFIPFYAIALIVSDPHAAIVQIFTFFPLSTPITALLRNAFGNLGVGETVAVIAELYIAATLVLWLAVQLFKHGSIEYTRRVNIRAALGAGRR